MKTRIILESYSNNKLVGSDSIAAAVTGAVRISVAYRGISPNRE